jgi:hypothetical protein
MPCWKARVYWLSSPSSKVSETMTRGCLPGEEVLLLAPAAPQAGRAIATAASTAAVVQRDLAASQPDLDTDEPEAGTGRRGTGTGTRGDPDARLARAIRRLSPMARAWLSSHLQVTPT